MINRRTFASNSAATLGFFSLGGCLEPLPLPLPPVNRDAILDRPIVDAHVHIFNAKDLPSFQFIAQVYIEPVLGVLSLGPHVLLMAMAHHVESSAPDDVEEREALRGNRKAVPTTEDLVTSSLLTLEEGSLPVRATNAPLARSPRGPAPAAAAMPLAVSDEAPESPSPDVQRAAFAALAGRTTVPPSAAAPAAAPPPIGAPIDRVARARQIAAGLLAPQAPRIAPVAPAAPAAAPPATPAEHEPPGKLQQLLHWLQEFAQYRAQRIDAWERVVGGTGNRFCMPALVDFGFSLRNVDETDLPLARQVRLMGELSRSQKPGRLVHGFVPFNPLRYALRGSPALDLVKEGIEKHGFLGVKLYPPMGFRVFDNVGARPDLHDLLRYLGRPFTADPVGFTRKVDQGLVLLFDYCAANDVAIMVHTNPSNLAYRTYHDRPNPAHWREVLRGRSRMRVNFGHFGGARERSEDEGRQNYAWAREIIRLFADYPNTYGDFADYEQVLEDGAPSMADLAAFLKSLDPAQKALMHKRLMFGTDWSMLAREPNHHLFASKMLRFTVDTLGGSVDDYAAHNALRFAGLDDDSSLATARLVEFHKTGSVNGPALQEFRKLVRRTI